MKAFCSAFIGVSVIFFICACGEPPQVVQGIVTGYDSSSKVLTVKEQPGHTPERLFSIKDAEMGAEPVIGDEVRLSYYDKDGRLVASRLMNLTRQAEIGRLAKDKEKKKK